jgi:hypothetical protein
MRRRAVGAAPAPRAGPSPPAVRTPSWRGPHVGQRGRAHGLSPTPVRCRRPGRAVRTSSRWPRAAPNASGHSRPSHLACMRTIRPARRRTYSSCLAFARAQLRTAPPCPPSPPAGDCRCAPLSTAPAQAQA